jgi:hypothetical protein
MGRLWLYLPDHIVACVGDQERAVSGHRHLGRRRTTDPFECGQAM